MAPAISELRRQANEAYHLGDLELAADLYTQAIHAAPSSADLYAERARTLIRLRRHDEAVIDIDKALEFDSNMHRAYLLKCIAFMFLDDHKKAKVALALGYSYGHDDSKFNNLLKICNQRIADMANKAYSEGDYKVAAELCTLVIDTEPAAADLHAYRAMIFIHLRKHNEAIADAARAIQLDHTMHKAYLLKGIAFMSLRDYQNAKDALELGQCYSFGDLRITGLLKRCKDRIADEDIQELVRNAEAAPAAPSVAASVEHKDAADLESAHSPGKPKYKYFYYNTPTEVVLSICAKGVAPDSVTIDFGEQTLRVSLKVPGEELEIIQYHLFSKFCHTWEPGVSKFWRTYSVVPDNCKYEVLTTKIKILLAKAEPITWTSLSQNSMSTPVDYEFSWVKKRLNKQKLLPPVQNQGKKDTCLFHALTTTAKIELNRQAALNDPPGSSKVNFSTNEFICQSFDVGLKIFKEEGVLCREKNGKRRKYRIQGYRLRKNLGFSKIMDLIKEGRPVVGGILVDDRFYTLRPNDIYDDDFSQPNDEDDVPTGHAVVFVGYGVRAGRAYLVFQNSYGTGFGDRGFGRIYFGHVKTFYTVDV